MIFATLSVSLGESPCGSGSAGLGAIGVVGGPRNGTFRLFGTVVDANTGLGTVDICGYLTSTAGLGVACSWHKGHSGEGRLGDLMVTGAGWKISGPTSLTMHGQGDDSSGPAGLVIQLYYGTDPACVTENQTDIPVQGEWVLADEVPDSPNETSDLVDPKDDGPSSAINLWGDKY